MFTLSYFHWRCSLNWFCNEPKKKSNRTVNMTISVNYIHFYIERYCRRWAFELRVIGFCLLLLQVTFFFSNFPSFLLLKLLVWRLTKRIFLDGGFFCSGGYGWKKQIQLNALMLNVYRNPYQKKWYIYIVGHLHMFFPLDFNSNVYFITIKYHARNKIQSVFTTARQNFMFLFMAIASGIGMDVITLKQSREIKNG